MTVIVWDGRTLAGDREASTSFIKCFRTTKVHRIRGHLVGLSGISVLNAEWREWFARGASAEDFPSFARDAEKCGTALVITPDGDIHMYQQSPYPVRHEGPRHAVGSGAEAALAAMEMGADAARAVEVASLICNGVGGGVDVITLLESTSGRTSHQAGGLQLPEEASL